MGITVRVTIKTFQGILIADFYTSDLKAAMRAAGEILMALPGKRYRNDGPRADLTIEVSFIGPSQGDTEWASS